MAKYDTIVIKIGSSTLTNDKGQLDLINLKRIAREVSELKKKVIIVTSGAIVTGSDRLGLKSKPRTIPEKQAAAAIGQSILMRQYEKAFEEFGVTVAQILLTKDEIENHEKRVNAKNTISTLLQYNIVPIVNENDSVAVEEIKIGDNDTLSAHVAVNVKACLLILLTDIDGFYMKSEEGIPYKVDRIEEISEDVIEAAGKPSTQLGTGGMATKIQAAKIVNHEGIPLVIAHGRKEGLLMKIVEGENVGTLFMTGACKKGH